MVHDGHRKRLRTKFIKDPSSLEDHELFELLLFFSIPRVNTNEIAHELLKRFGSIKDIIDTGYNTLQSVDGIGESSALLLRIMSEITARYERSKYQDIFRLDSHATLAAYLRSLFVGAENEVMYLLMFDNSKHLLACEKIAEGTACSAKVSIRKIASLSMAYNATAVILAHNHPNGRAIPSGNDLATTNSARMVLSGLDIFLAEHFIVAGDACTPIINNDKAGLYNPQYENK